MFLFCSNESISSGKWGTQTNKVKDMYDVEIREARRIIDDTAKDRASAELRAKRAEEETLKFKDKYSCFLYSKNSIFAIYFSLDMKDY